MRFPQTFIDDLRRQADIVRIVQDYVTLKKTGANWSARCPFHKETKPSFSVNPAKEIFYCFGCQKGGSVFNFIMEIERVTFPEAIKIVAEKSGVPLPKMIDDSRFEARKRESDQVIELNQWALQWWQDQLQSKAATSVRQYLKQRGLTEETAKTFRLGFAPDSWEALSTHLRQKGASQELLERSGLVVKKDEGGSYDRFRGRLIFPVFDAQGKPIAFGGRTLDPEGEPKYLNSPETPAYTKGRHLFGLNLTRDYIRRENQAMLVEGYLDLIPLFQHGARNVVASLGTALTAEQAKLIGRFARRVLVNYDGDRAGIQAAKKAIEILLAEDLAVEVFVLPEEADPDEFLKAQGIEEYEQQRRAKQERSDFRRAEALVRAQNRTENPRKNAWRRRAGLPDADAVEEIDLVAVPVESRGRAQPHIAFIIDQAVRERNLNDAAQKAAAVKETLPFIRAVRDRIQRRGYFDEAMDRLRIPKDQRRELWHVVATDASIDGAAVQKAVSQPLKPTVAEKQLLRLLLGSAELRKIVVPRLEPTDYEGLATAALFGAMVRLTDDEREVSFDSLSAETADNPSAGELLARLLIAESTEAFDEAMAQADSCLNALRLMKLDREIDELSSQVAEAERAGEAERRDTLSLQLLELSKQRSSYLPATHVSKTVH